MMKEYKDFEIEEMASALKDGAVLAFPTDTVYGVGSVYGDLDALKRLKSIKRRPEEKPIPMMCASLDQVKDIVVLNDMAKALAGAFLPGAMTLIVKITDNVDRAFTNGKDTIALRIPDAPVLLKIIEATGRPLMVSSANLSGEPAALSKEQAMDMLPALDGILDGVCREGIASTIVDCTGEKAVILRQGPISAEEIEAVLA